MQHHIRVDHGRSICEAPGCSHNRWHPAIAPALRVGPGDRVDIETRDSLDGQILASMSGADLANVDLDPCHVLTGPIHVEGAEPGDVVAVHIEELRPADHGFTAILPGLGLLADLYPDPFLIHWEMADGFATSPQLPGIRIAGNPFMGVMGLAPSLERVARVNAREASAAARGAFILPPSERCAVPAAGAPASEGWRTVAAHETGGNLDIRHLVAGSVLYLPVDVAGGLFSTGDAHFAQGDGETCGTAIETSATVSVRFELHKPGAMARAQAMPWFTTAAGDAGKRRYIATTGISVDGDEVGPFDVRLAARNAVREMIAMLGHEHGLSPQQAYCLVSVAADLRISSIVNTPHALVSAFLPLDIFVG